MKKFLQKSYHVFTRWGQTFPPFGFLFFNFLNLSDRAVTFVYRLRGLTDVYHTNCDNQPLADPDVLDLVTVAFNNVEVIDWQIKFLKKNLRDKFSYTVADNSMEPEVSASIKQICWDSDVGYIRLPPNPYNGKFTSWSHGLALNWTYRNFIRPRRANYFGFLDHDIFPVEPVAVVSFLKQCPMYGVVQTRGNKWHLWPGFSFFRREVFSAREANFSSLAYATPLASVMFDTGGANWPALYSKIERGGIREAAHIFAFLPDMNKPEPGDSPYKIMDLETLRRHYDVNTVGANDRFIEFIDGWLHMRRMGYGSKGYNLMKIKVLETFFGH